MIGFYNYTVILTYLSLLSAGLGILVSLSGAGHPFIGIFFLLFSGLCDAFDGKVARTKKNRSDMEKGFGIQIDSLSDLVAFGVLPACIGAALMRVSPLFNDLKELSYYPLIEYILLTFLILYILAALIRLAYFNVTEEERQKNEEGARKTYIGLPVTSSSLIFPTIMLIYFISPIDLSLLYFIGIIITGFLFVSKIQIKKPGLKEILFMIGIGAIEFIIMLIVLLTRGR